MRGDCLYLFYCIFVIGFFSPLKSRFFDGVLFSFYFFYRKIKHSENQRCKFFFYFAHPFFIFFMPVPER